MALIDKLRFQSVLSRGGVHEAQATEFSEALQDTFDDQLGRVARTDDLVILREQLRADNAEREARQNRQMLVWVGLMLALYVGVTAVAVAILLAVLT